MDIAVFGATGATGQQLIGQARPEHRLRGLTRSPEELSPESGIEPVKGNVLDPESVRKTVAGNEAVVCILGRTKNNPSDVVSRGTSNIVDAMIQYELERLVVVTSIGLGSSIKNLPWYGRLANATVLQNLMADKARQEEVIMESPLDWTIVRPGGLTGGSKSGEYVHGVDLDVHAAPISRADVADFLLTVLDDRLYVRETPLVTTQEEIRLSFLWEQVTDVTNRLLWGK